VEGLKEEPGGNLVCDISEVVDCGEEGDSVVEVCLNRIRG